MDTNTQSITVAIADPDRDRRLEFERLLHEVIGVTLLTNGKSNNEVGNKQAFMGRRSKSSKGVTAYEDEVARIQKLQPFILVINLNKCTDDDYAFLLSLRRICPHSRVILVIDDAILESQMMRALAIGTLGYLKFQNIENDLVRAIRVVSRGEAWIPRKIIGNIMEYMSNLKD